MIIKRRDEKNIYAVTLWEKNVTIPIDDILGYEVRSHERNVDRLYLIPRDENIPWIKVSHGKEVEWIKQRYKRLDGYQFSNELSRISENPLFGETRRKRLTLYKWARITAYTANITAFALIFPTIFVPMADIWQLALLPAWCLLGFVILIIFKGLIRFHFEDGSAHLNLAPLFISVSCFFYFRISYSYSTAGAVDFRCLYFFAVTAIFFSALLLLSRGHFFQQRLYVMATVFALLASAALSYATILLVDLCGDNAAAREIPLVVRTKRIEHHKNTSYIISFDIPNKLRLEELPTSEAVYDSLRTGDTLHAVLHPGNLDIPWYYRPLPQGH